MGELKEYEISKVPYMHIYGRTGRITQPLPLFFNGSGIEVKINGEELWVDVETDCDFLEMWVAYEINGAFIGRQMLLPGRHSLCLLRRQDPNEIKTVKFYRELQAAGDEEKSFLTVHSIKTDGDFFKTDEHNCKLEFIGDSITSGEGSYGNIADTVWVSMYMSASVNYATMTSKALNADYRLLSQGGWGVFSGWDNDFRHNIPSVYEKVCGLAPGEHNKSLGAADDYDFSFGPDAIIVNLGTNDNSAFNSPPFTDPDTGEVHHLRRDPDGSFNKDDIKLVENAIVDFLKMLRKHNPGAHIVWCYGMLGCELTLPITNAINTYRGATGDKNVAFLGLPNTTHDEYGSHMHPGLKSHKKAAAVLTDYLNGVLKQG